ncbi:HesA/MoeB/ThiF family protein [Desulfovibrio cuneatus]|uniref:HesA/MoeB/ThiF family protein n=1 Tax=Desulfovibrio cuneatus TaxID=159728 RepID=UPI0003FD454C|nr:ThiF family adenylyltransferase [Desulfovibrio cuneatus]
MPGPAPLPSPGAVPSPLPQELLRLVHPHLVPCPPAQNSASPTGPPAITPLLPPTFPNVASNAISLGGVAAVSAFFACPPAEAMARCLEAGLWPLRFLRNRGVLSPLDQATLLRSRVTVLGCGGLGGYVLLLLARLGVGALRFCDPDTFEETNLNRQALCREDRIGLNKAEAAKAELALVASHVATECHPIAATPETLPALLHGTHALVDCLDSIPARQYAAAAAVAHNVPFVHGTIAGWEGFALLCPATDNTFSRLYPPSKTAPAHGAEATLGTPAPTPQVTAALQAMLTLRALLPLHPSLPSPDILMHLDLGLPEIELLFV